MNIGYAFREARFKKFPNKEKTQGEIAVKAGISQTYLSQIELGEKVPSMDVIESLCKVYDIPPSILFWMAMEAKDVKKNKQKAFEMLKGPVNNLINEFFVNNNHGR